MALFRRQPKQLSLPGMKVPKTGPLAKPEPGTPGRIRRMRSSLLNTRVTRRGFLSRSLGWVTAGMAAALGIPAAAAIVSPAFRKETSQWSPVGNLAKPGPGEADLTKTNEPILTHFTSLVSDAYMNAAPQDVSIYVVNKGNGQFTIFDDRCTHLGCPFSWKDADKKFYCPCHGGVFDIDGRVLGGPPPRPLDRYDYRIENDILMAGPLYKVNDQLQRDS